MSHGIDEERLDLARTLALEDARKRGPLAWMASNSVAANLIMGLLLVGGLVFGASKVKQEVFPEFSLDMVTVRVAYPGASPAEVEQGIVEAVEEAVRGLDGVKRVTSTASEGLGSTTIELLDGVDASRVTADIKNAVDRITSFPLDAEEPLVSLLVARRQVISLVLYGDLDNHALKEVGEEARDALLARKEITQVDVSGLPPVEIDVEIPQETLRRYGLTLDGVAGAIRAASLELPGGGVKTPGGEVLVRTTERADWGEEFAELPIRAATTGTRIRVGDLGVVKDGFAETDEQALFNGQPAVRVDVYRVGDQTPIEVADAVKEVRDELQARLPPSVHVDTWQDMSQIYRGRIDLLLRNAYLGLVLVLVVLGLFLDLRLAFWVTLGIPASFAGALLLMPAFDISLNMITLFAFIVTLGMVVDDAIVVGENVYELRQRGLAFKDAAVAGVRQVAGPVVFAVLTTVAAFMPMFFVPGIMGKFFEPLPAIVTFVLLISLVESLLVLPSHLAHAPRRDKRGLAANIAAALRLLTLPLWPALWLFGKLNRGTTRLLAWNIQRLYMPLAHAAVRYRYATLGLAGALFFAAVGLIAGGRIDFTFMPKIESDRVTASLLMPYGTPVQETMKVQRHMVEAARQILDELGHGEEVDLGMYTTVGAPVHRGGLTGGSVGLRGGHQATVQVRLVPLGERTFTAREFTKRWRQAVGHPAGAEMVSFAFNIGASPGAPVHVQLSHRDMDVLERASAFVAQELEAYGGVRDVDSGFSPGKPQLDFHLTPLGQSLGLTAQQVARQLRSAFYGAEALRQQRGRDEVRVLVRLPADERRSEHDIETLMLRTPQGGEVPLREAATAVRGRSYTSITRQGGRRIVAVTADIEQGATTADKVMAAIRKDILPALRERFPGVGVSFEGEAAERRDSMKGLAMGYLLALFLIYALLAVPFKSYLQPLVVMTAIPLGLVGALLGHYLMGFDLSLISIMGIVALSGVVVNDSLVLVDAANTLRRDLGMSAHEAVVAAGARRFRPILLTSVTTFFGLAPMIFETSVQARFLIPMAISLGYGVLFATAITLIVIPASYMVVEDVRHVFGFGDVLPDGEGGEGGEDARKHHAPQPPPVVDTAASCREHDRESGGRARGAAPA